MSQGPMRVLIVAENASVRFGGEAILPYHYFRLLLARGIDVHLVVHERTRDEVVSLFPAQPGRLHFVKDIRLQKLFYSIGRGLPRRIDEATLGLANQFLTQLRQRRVIARMATAHCVVHQATPVSPRTPSLLYGMGVPVVIGPLNGGMEYPAAFRRTDSWVSRAVVNFGRRSSNLLNAIFPGKRNAAVVLVANERTRNALPTGLRGRVLMLAENGVDTGIWTAASAPAEQHPRFLFIGRLVDWKALDIVLEALAAVPGARLDIIGDGAMMEKWKALARRLDIADRVHFQGWLSQEQCAQHLAGCCALVLPSLYECGGAVVLEAMAMSIPVIATAWGGPLDYLDASCGILVEPTSREALVTGFADAMMRLAASPEERKRMGEAGRQRLLREFDWQRKIEAILSIYQSATDDAPQHAAEEVVR